jgi:hypothetical protein
MTLRRSILEKILHELAAVVGEPERALECPVLGLTVGQIANVTCGFAVEFGVGKSTDSVDLSQNIHTMELVHLLATRPCVLRY